MNVLKKISCIFIKIFKRYSACILHRFCKSNIPNIILFGVLLNWLKQIVGVNPMSQIWPYFYTDVFKINLNTLTFTSSAKWHRGVRFKWGDVQIWSSLDPFLRIDLNSTQINEIPVGVSLPLGTQHYRIEPGILCI